MFTVKNSTIVAEDGRVVALFGLAVLKREEAESWTRACCAAMNEDYQQQQRQGLKLPVKSEGGERRPEAGKERQP